MRSISRLMSVAVGLALLLTFGAGKAAAQNKSASLAKQLAANLEAGNLTSIAARDPVQRDLYVAALHVPGTLLVVWARYPVPAALDEKLAKKDFQNVYIDLQTASIAASKVFVQDAGADGLNLKSFDTVDTANGSTVFDGDWKKAKAGSEQAYEKALADVDAEYARMLGTLLASIKTPAL
jgi:hypothetical protein